MSKYDATVGQIGYRIILQVTERDPVTEVESPSDLTGVTLKTMTIKRPDETTKTYPDGDVTFSPPPIGDSIGTEGHIEASTVAGDLTIEGDYEVSAYLEESPEKGHTHVGSFVVGPVLA